jgi:hypothetical protein
MEVINLSTGTVHSSLSYSAHPLHCLYFEAKCVCVCVCARLCVCVWQFKVLQYCNVVVSDVSVTLPALCQTTLRNQVPS